MHSWVLNANYLVLFKRASEWAVGNVCFWATYKGWVPLGFGVGYLDGVYIRESGVEDEVVDAW